MPGDSLAQKLSAVFQVVTRVLAGGLPTTPPQNRRSLHGCTNHGGQGWGDTVGTRLATRPQKPTFPSLREAP
jgi:hypothetical protein